MIDLDITIETITDELELELDSSGVIPEPYEGPYTVTPVFRDQVLETTDLLMTDDITVKEIPVAEVSNPAGGVTLTIG